MDEREVASECSEGYNSGYNSDCNSGDREVEVTVVAAAMREWDKQHAYGWLHSPEERAADRSEAEQELAKVVHGSAEGMACSSSNL